MVKTLDALNASIELQSKKLAEMKAKKQQLEARERSKLKQASRSVDTRRKILLGSYVLAAMNVKGELVMPPEIRALRLSANSIALDTFLTREDDRVLFGYPSLVPVASPAPASPAVVAAALMSAPDNLARAIQPQANVYARREAKDLI